MEMEVIKDKKRSTTYMVPRIFFGFFIAILAVSSSIAQSSKKSRRDKNTSPEQSTTLEPYYPKKEYGPKVASKKSHSFFVYDAEKKYYERREAIEKEWKRTEKERLKPQHSDPAHFGHKRLPKKHKPRKMKYCRECGIRH